MRQAQEFTMRSACILAEQAECIIYIETRDMQDATAFLFLKLRGDKLVALKSALKQEKFNPRSLGEVLLYGAGKPSAEEWKRMQNAFGITPEKLISFIS